VVVTDETGTKLMVLNGGFGRSAARFGKTFSIPHGDTASSLPMIILTVHRSGSQTINSVWKDGLPNATLVSDRWAAQLKAFVQNHQLCLASS
jgi:hypothetical protein